MAAQKQNSNLKKHNSHLKSQISRLESALTTTKEEFAKAATHRDRLQTQVASETTQKNFLTDLELDMQRLQSRYEETDRAHKTLRHDHRELEESHQKVTRKFEAQATEIISLKEKIKSLKDELAQAHKDLVSSGDPDIARLAKAEEVSRASVAEAEKSNKKIGSLNSELDLIRGVYQQASTQVTDLGEQNSELSRKLEVAERQAQGEFVKMRRSVEEKALKKASSKAQMAKSQVADRDRLLRRKDEEILELKGRRGRGVMTRQGSAQPGAGTRSPRGSRGGSPLPGSGITQVGGEGMRRGGSGLRFGVGSRDE